MFLIDIYYARGIFPGIERPHHIIDMVAYVGSRKFSGPFPVRYDMIRISDFVNLDSRFHVSYFNSSFSFSDTRGTSSSVAVHQALAMLVSSRIGTSIHSVIPIECTASCRSVSTV